MKKSLFFFALLFSAHTLFAQWTIPYNINVGVSQPNGRITGYANATNSNIGQMAFSTMHDGGAVVESMRITQDGFLGIGNPYPTVPLHVGAADGWGGSPYASSTLLKIYQPFNTSITSASIDLGLATTHARVTGMGDQSDNSLGQMAFSTLKHGVITEAMRIDINGNIGIGTTTPGTNKLAVEGTIGARKVVVTLTTPFPDYVFNADHELPSLKNVAEYIKANRHLPGLPTAAEVEKKGIDLGNMQVKLVEKIEELTLYTIQLQRQVEILTAENKKMESLQQQIDELKNALKK